MIAVEYLHSIGVAHRDIKLENALLSEDGVSLRLADFGLAARLDEWEDSSGGVGAQVTCPIPRMAVLFLVAVCPLMRLGF